MGSVIISGGAGMTGLAIDGGGATIKNLVIIKNDGAEDGISGSDFIATTTGTRVTSGGIPLVRSEPSSVTNRVDHLLARDELAGLLTSTR